VKIRVGNTKLFFEVYGRELDLSHPYVLERPTLLFLHGGPGLDHTYEVPALAPLQERMQVIFLNHRGNGRSDGDDPSEWNLRQWATDVHDFCLALGLDKPYICGVSFGGHVAMLHSILYPDDAAGLILYNTEGYFSKEEMAEALGEPARRFFEDPNDQTAAELSKLAPMPEGYLDQCIHRSEVAYHHELEFDLLPDLPKIKCPVLYLASEENQFHRIECAKKTASHFSNGRCQFKSFPGKLLAVEHPELLREEISDFIL